MATYLESWSGEHDSRQKTNQNKSDACDTFCYDICNNRNIYVYIYIYINNLLAT